MNMHLRRVCAALAYGALTGLFWPALNGFAADVADAAAVDAGDLGRAAGGDAKPVKVEKKASSAKKSGKDVKKGDAVRSEQAIKAAMEAVQGVSASVAGADDGGVADGNGTVAVAPTDAEAEQAYEVARHAFFSVSTSLPGGRGLAVSSSQIVNGGIRRENVRLEDVRLVLDVEDVTLRDVVTRIVGQAAKYTGTWAVKWRLKPENAALLDERVNLTAEAPFGEFCALLTERVKNMTGTQLYVTAFNGSRIILVTDTYY